MRTRVRPFIAILLCGVLLLGHFPAWLHVVACHSTANSPHLSPTPASKDVASNSCCCHCDHECDSVAVVVDQHQQSRTNVEFAAATEWHDSQLPCQSEHQPTDHDSDRCVVCQSLYLAMDQSPEFDSLDRFELIPFLMVAIPERFSTHISLREQRPRGPPSST